ncbi:hypothetical protein E4U53_003831 [Claviceps sorghi]|nr:hypothetical protein E4U53_003831 [Claviceps sorghi]
MASQSEQCYDSITPHSMSSNKLCGLSGSFLIFGGWCAVMWVFLRSLSLHLQICWQVLVGQRFMLFAQAVGWGVPLLGITVVLVFSGVSFRFGPTCHINHKNSLADMWIPLLIFAGATVILTFATFGYCVRVYLASLYDTSASSERSSLPAYTNSVRTVSPRQAYRRVKRVVALQWRGIAIVLIIIADVIFFSVVFVFQDNVVQSVKSDPMVAEQWVTCLIGSSGDKNACLDQASSIVVNEATVSAVLLLLGLNGILLVFLLGRISMIGACPPVRDAQPEDADPLGVTIASTFRSSDVAVVAVVALDRGLRVKERPFRPATVGACHAQTATDRFGYEAKRAILDRERMSMSLDPEGIEWPIVNWPPSDSEDGEFDHVPATSIYKLIPSMQPFRNNLTALSQKYNLYFTAYRSRIYVYVPRSVPRQTIPRYPDAQIGTYPSPIARKVGGHIDFDAPHTINHLVVGWLGREEVVVTCHDDGDVTALYTKDIAEYIAGKLNMAAAATTTTAMTNTPTSPKQRRTSLSPTVSRRKPPKPFFQENVGISAWGIAIHQHSRLIAVSSNRAEITVFAPALATPAPQTPNCDCDSCCGSVEDRVRRRVRNWRIVIALGSLASNIPNISFVDDKHGNADKISAIDIKGAMWLADIWKPKQAAIRVAPATSPLLKSEEFWPEKSRGWGILALANKYFLTVHSEEELLGAPLRDLETVPKLQAGPHPMVNMAKYIRELPDNPCVQPVMQGAAVRLSFGINNGVFAVVAEDATMTDEQSDHGINFFADDPSDEEDVDEDEDEDDDVGSDESVEVDGSDNNDDSDVDEGEEEDDEDEDDEDGDDEDGDDDDDDDDYDDDIDEMLYPVNAGGGVPLESDVAPELANEQTDDSISAAVAAAPAADPMVEMVEPWNDGFDTPPANADLPVSSETALILQDLFTDLFTPAGGSQPPPCAGRATAEKMRDSVPSFSHCLSKAGTEDAVSHLNMTYMPHSGEVCVTPRGTSELLRFVQRPVEHNENSQEHVSGLAKFAGRYHMLRMYEKDLEMRTIEEADQKRLPEYGILCPYVLRMGLAPGRASRAHFRGTSRLSMVIHIPELFLIIIGSPVGRVILVTPTRLAHPMEKPPGILHHGLRLEWVLPRQSDEAVFRTNKRPMHGMAASPVQESGVLGEGKGSGASEKQQRAAMPRRYRLMLHYRNHDILTYELSREEETGKVCIF